MSLFYLINGSSKNSELETRDISAARIWKGHCRYFLYESTYKIQINEVTELSNTGPSSIAMLSQHFLQKSVELNLTLNQIRDSVYLTKIDRKICGLFLFFLAC